MTASRSDAVAWLVCAFAAVVAVAIIAELWRVQASHEARWEQPQEWENWGRE